MGGEECGAFWKLRLNHQFAQLKLQTSVRIYLGILKPKSIIPQY